MHFKFFYGLNFYGLMVLSIKFFILSFLSMRYQTAKKQDNLSVELERILGTCQIGEIGDIEGLGSIH